MFAAGVNSFLDLTRPGECDSYLSWLPTNIEYDNRPLIDHGIPEAEEQMRDVLDVAHEALRRRRTLYVHCRAGIGRTGTVIGCLLAELGVPGEPALAELNRLWQQCARSRSWLAVPETVEQTQYVLNWRPLREQAAIVKNTSARVPAAASENVLAAAAAPQPLAVRARAVATDDAGAGALRERFHGAVLGLAVGDALAAATQGRAPGSFAPLTDLVEGALLELPRGGWSDDTAMALCLADSLLERRSFDARDQVQRFVRWQTEGYLSATGRCIGITAGVTKALAAARFRRQMFAGSHDPKQRDKDPLTRVAPSVLYYFASASRAVHQATEAARTTCQAPAVLAATAFFAAVLHAAVSGVERDRLLAPDPASWTRKPADRRLAALARGDYAPQSAQGGGSSDAIEVLQAALRIFASTANFRDGALAAANLGGDSDVIGAIYGQLAGAYYGVQAIPLTWREALLRRELLEDYAQKLFRHAAEGGAP